MTARARDCRARVVATRALAPRVLEADLAMVEPPALAFEAGQWVSVPFGPRRVRAYSIASTPLEPRTITLCADLAPDGIGSRWLRQLGPGDEVAFKGPLGGFVFAAADPRQPLFVAEEIGIVPIRAILAWLDATGWDRPARLVHWAGDPGGLIYEAEFRRLAARRPGFAYHPLTAGMGAEPAGAPAAVAAAVAGLMGGVGDLVAYVCGSGPLIDRVREVLMARGLERRAVRWERFW